MLRRRERGEPRTRVSWLGLLWVFPIGGVFFAGDRFIPETRSRWLDALLWAGYGFLWGAIGLGAERRVRSIRHLAPAAGLFPRPIGWVVMFTILFVGSQFVPKGSDLWSGVPGAVAYLVFAVDHFLRARESR